MGPSRSAAVELFERWSRRRPPARRVASSPSACLELEVPVAAAAFLDEAFLDETVLEVKLSFVESGVPDMSDLT